MPCLLSYPQRLPLTDPNPMESKSAITRLLNPSLLPWQRQPAPAFFILDDKPTVHLSACYHTAAATALTTTPFTKSHITSVQTVVGSHLVWWRENKTPLRLIISSAIAETDPSSSEGRKIIEEGEIAETRVAKE